ncbi:hypothetical protein GQ53DRAFT_765831 [Thozetella sp. PMI_491]|nr:hypothetical protein GQ53DRAFT_765831 [Thozetella sp. PMI_491]
MMQKPALYLALSLLTTSVVSHQGLHLATHGLLQIHPSFTGEGISLFPGLHPDHDLDDLEHLTPKLSNELYYSQEGHRPAVHGAKHGSMNANFNLPAVILDHTSGLRSIKCRGNQRIDICLKPEAFRHAQNAWNISQFILVTYHIGCGDELSGKRSYFHAEHPQFDTTSACITLATAPIEQEDAVDSGKISWGTFHDPEKNKTMPVKGHVRLSEPVDPFLARRDSPHKRNSDKPSTRPDRNSTVDLNDDKAAAISFFGDINPDFSGENEILPDSGFINTDGTTETTDTANDEAVRRRAVAESRPRLPPPTNRLKSRFLGGLFKSLWNAIKGFVESVVNFVKKSVKTITSIAQAVAQLAIITVKLILVQFGVPFRHTYHDDFKVNYTVEGEISKRPPAILDFLNGLEIAGVKGETSVQCLKCGVHVDISVEGTLAFSLKQGITEGRLSLYNNDPFEIDAVFGIKVDGEYSIELVNQQIAAVPLSPLTIPGIITLGPQLSISGLVELEFSGEAEAVIGGSLSIDTGGAVVDLVQGFRTHVWGFETNFTPVAKFDGTVTAALQLGLPIALEVGLDVLNGKFKATAGFVNTPMVYASATITTNEESKCSKGVELRLGVKNKIAIEALDVLEKELREDVLYEKGIACITADGFDTSAVNPDVSVFIPVTEELKNDIANETFQITDIASKIEQKNNTIGFRIIMDVTRKSILVAGEDGYIYLVDTRGKYDLSAPWGTAKPNSTVIDLDVFGRIMAYTPDDSERLAAEVTLWDPAWMPPGEKAAAFAVLEGQGYGRNLYGVLLARDDKKFVYYPTFCKTDKGNRLAAATTGAQDQVNSMITFGPYMRSLPAAVAVSVTTVGVTPIVEKAEASMPKK